MSNNNDTPAIPNLDELLQAQMRYRANVVEYYSDVLTTFERENPSPIEVIVLCSWLIATLTTWEPAFERIFSTELAAAQVLYRDMLSNLLEGNASLRAVEGPIYIHPQISEADDDAPPTRPDPAVMLFNPVAEAAQANLTSDPKPTVN